eukprot:6294669-Prymnesium_polylepis.3
MSVGSTARQDAATSCATASVATHRRSRMTSALNRDFRRGTEEAWRPPPPLLRRGCWSGARTVR